MSKNLFRLDNELNILYAKRNVLINKLNIISKIQPNQNNNIKYFIENIEKKIDILNKQINKKEYSLKQEEILIKKDKKRESRIKQAQLLVQQQQQQQPKKRNHIP